MDFMEAVKAMKEGKKVKRKPNQWFCIKDDEIYYQTGEKTSMSLEAIEATDWEIIEEKKTLSDKMHNIELRATGASFDGEKTVGMHSLTNWIDSADVKQFIKDVIDYLDGELTMRVGGSPQEHTERDLINRIKQRAGELAGDRLFGG